MGWQAERGSAAVLNLLAFGTLFVVGTVITLLFLTVFLSRGQAQAAADSAALGATQGLKEALVDVALSEALRRQRAAAERVDLAFADWLEAEEADGRSPSHRQQERQLEALWQAEVFAPGRGAAAKLAAGEPLKPAEQIGAFVSSQHLGCLALRAAEGSAARALATEVAARNLAPLSELRLPAQGHSFFEVEATRSFALSALGLRREVKGHARASLRSLADVAIDYDNPHCP